MFPFLIYCFNIEAGGDNVRLGCLIERDAKKISAWCPETDSSHTARSFAARVSVSMR